MHSVDLLEEAIRVARAIGYVVREEWLDGAGGGDCEIRGRKHLFLDLSLGVHERLQCVLNVLQREPAVRQLNVTEALARLLGSRRPDKAA